jgi:hypothetical protein
VRLWFAPTKKRIITIDLLVKSEHNVNFTMSDLFFDANEKMQIAVFPGDTESGTMAGGIKDCSGSTALTSKRRMPYGR